jgi:proline iminopeptidase
MTNSNEKMILIETPIGKFNVWTKQVGINPRIKVLLLHGGPGGTHELFQIFENFLPNAGIEFYYYNQLGSFLSEQPNDNSLWTIESFVDEVEQVRKALGLNKNNFYLLGHSWGGILALEYALLHQNNLKALIISNMMSSAADYAAYAENVLAKGMDPIVLKEIKELEANKDYENPKYMELLIPNFYFKHFCRLQPRPDVFNQATTHLNYEIYTLMQGPSEFGISGLLEKWNRKDDLSKIEIPTLTIGATFDTMDPEHMKWMSTQVQNGSVLICPNGSHCSMWDDPEHYFPGLIQFIKTVDQGQKTKLEYF